MRNIEITFEVFDESKYAHEVIQVKDFLEA